MSRSRKRAYTGSRAFDPSCRHGGTCPYCEAGRQFSSHRQQPLPELPPDVTDSQAEVLRRK